MITLSNGSKWILNDSEWADKDVGISYEEACKGNIPAMDIKGFIEKLISGGKYKGRYLDPAKLISMDGMGYWDSDLDPHREVFEDVAVKSVSNKCFTAYEMPWGNIIMVAYNKSDEDENHEYVESMVRFKNKEEYMKAVLL